MKLGSVLLAAASAASVAAEDIELKYFFGSR